MKDLRPQGAWYRSLPKPKTATTRSMCTECFSDWQGLATDLRTGHQHMIIADCVNEAEHRRQEAL